MVDFNALANKKLEDVERPPLLPVGHYRFQVSKLPEQDSNPDSEWYIIEFNLRPVEALDDVDPEDLAAFGDLKAVTLRKAFMCARDGTEADVDRMFYQVKRFLIDHLKCADENMSVAEGLASAMMAECTGQVVHKADKNDKELFHANIGRTAAVE